MLKILLYHRGTRDILYNTCRYFKNSPWNRVRYNFKIQKDLVHLIKTDLHEYLNEQHSDVYIDKGCEEDSESDGIEP